jgi:hypothetical protein
MTLEGFVTTGDARGLERAAHQHFRAARIAASGGTEYSPYRLRMSSHGLEQKPPALSWNPPVRARGGNIAIAPRSNVTHRSA